MKEYLIESSQIKVKFKHSKGPEEGGRAAFYAEREKVRQHGSGAESRSRTVYAKLESNSESERVRVCQRVTVRASESQSESYREPQRARERQGESQREPVKA